MVQAAAAATTTLADTEAVAVVEVVTEIPVVRILGGKQYHHGVAYVWAFFFFLDYEKKKAVCLFCFLHKKEGRNGKGLKHGAIFLLNFLKGFAFIFIGILSSTWLSRFSV